MAGISKEIIRQQHQGQTVTSSVHCCSSLAFYALSRRHMFQLPFALRGSDRTVVRRSSHYTNPCCNFDPL